MRQLATCGVPKALNSALASLDRNNRQLFYYFSLHIVIVRFGVVLDTDGCLDGYEQRITVSGNFPVELDC